MKIIFLHGFPDSSEVWRYQLRHLAGRAECEAPDLYSLNYEQQISKIRELVGNKSVILVAHDMGGPAAVDFAAIYPEFVERLVLINSMSLNMFAQRLRNLNQLLRSSYMSIFVNPFVNTTTLKWFHKKILGLIYNAGKLPSDDPLREGKAEVLDGLGRYKELMWKIPSRLFESLVPLSMPVDLIFGKADPVLLVPTEKEARRYFDNARIHTLPAGHWPMRTHATELNQLLDQILFASSEIKK
jgi:pimeloyl-ACP methyl ester carboxylesterase